VSTDWIVVAFDVGKDGAARLLSGVKVHRAFPLKVLMSRDRGGDYASAVRTSAPQAVQCADRFHLLKNLVEAAAP
jgi:hypothetical protein